MKRECWWCHKVYYHPRNMRLCGACFIERYQVAPKIKGKFALKRRAR